MKRSALPTTRQKALMHILPKRSGRNNTGQITVRHQGGRHKRYFREVDFRRDKIGVPGKVVGFSYDPNRNVDIALIQYNDGEKRYILQPVGLKVDDSIASGHDVEISVGNCLPLSAIPVGTAVHNVELHAGRGGQMARGAGGMASVMSKDAGFVTVKLPSGEVRRIHEACKATIGQVANVEWKNEILGKAGRARHMGRRPSVRGVAMNPSSHPHGGGEGRSGEGMHPKTPWGKPARGLKTRTKGKFSDRYIVQKRKRKTSK